jgi:hypothetical protein
MRLDPGSREERNWRRAAGAIASLVGLWLAPTTVAASDGGSSSDPDAGTYLVRTLNGASAEALETTDAGVPTALHVEDGLAIAEYRRRPRADGRAGWDLRISGFERNHERIDAVYDIVLVLPLPVDASGRPAFETRQHAITPREGTEDASVPLIYGGEKVTLKRNVSLEKTFLPGLVGDPAKGRLPSLAGTGYAYTLWDTIVAFDEGFGARVQGWGSFRYDTNAKVPPPDPADPALAAYLITWIPSLRADVRPFALRIDVRPPALE